MGQIPKEGGPARSIPHVEISAMLGLVIVVLVDDRSFGAVWPTNSSIIANIAEP